MQQGGGDESVNESGHTRYGRRKSNAAKTFPHVFTFDSLTPIKKCQYKIMVAQLQVNVCRASEV